MLILMIMGFLLVYYNTSGPIAWMYASETCTDVAVGISLFTLWSFIKRYGRLPRFGREKPVNMFSTNKAGINA